MFYCTHTHANTHKDMTSALLTGARPLYFPGFPPSLLSSVSSSSAVSFSISLFLIFVSRIYFHFFVNMFRANPESTGRKEQQIWFQCFLSVLLLLLLLDSSPCWPHSGSAAAVFLCLQLDSDSISLLHYSPATFFRFLRLCLISLYHMPAGQQIIRRSFV